MTGLLKMSPKERRVVPRSIRLAVHALAPHRGSRRRTKTRTRSRASLSRVVRHDNTRARRIINIMITRARSS